MAILDVLKEYSLIDSLGHVLIC